MRPPHPGLRSFLFLVLLGAAACSDVEGADTSAATEAPAPDESDALAKRAIQLLDSATQVVGEVAEKAPVENAAGTLKALGVELQGVLAKLKEKGVAIGTDPRWKDQWTRAQEGLAGALSALASANPSASKILTPVVEGLSFGKY